MGIGGIPASEHRKGWNAGEQWIWYREKRTGDRGQGIGVREQKIG
jgi:hypothetical protein